MVQYFLCYLHYICLSITIFLFDYCSFAETLPKSKCSVFAKLLQKFSTLLQKVFDGAVWVLIKTLSNGPTFEIGLP